MTTTTKIVLPALGAHGIKPRPSLATRLAKAAPFPAAETTAEILEIAKMVAEAGFLICSPEQHQIVLRESGPGEKGDLIGEDPENPEHKEFFTKKTAARGHAGSKLWFVAKDYPFAISYKDQIAIDKAQHESRRAAEIAAAAAAKKAEAEKSEEK